MEPGTPPSRPHPMPTALPELNSGPCCQEPPASPFPQSHHPLTDEGLAPGHKLNIKEVGFHPRAVCSKALPLLGLRKQAVQWGHEDCFHLWAGRNRQRLQGIQKRVLGFKEGFPEVVAFEMSLEGF